MSEKRIVSKFISQNKEEIYQNIIKKDTMDSLYPIRDKCPYCNEKLTPKDRIWCPFCGLEM